jgi:hypothetical protein
MGRMVVVCRRPLHLFVLVLGYVLYFKVRLQLFNYVVLTAASWLVNSYNWKVISAFWREQNVFESLWYLCVVPLLQIQALRFSSYNRWASFIIGARFSFHLLWRFVVSEHERDS